MKFTGTCSRKAHATPSRSLWITKRIANFTSLWNSKQTSLLSYSETIFHSLVLGLLDVCVWILFKPGPVKPQYVLTKLWEESRPPSSCMRRIRQDSEARPHRYLIKNHVASFRFSLFNFFLINHSFHWQLLLWTPLISTEEWNSEIDSRNWKTITWHMILNPKKCWRQKQVYWFMLSRPRPPAFISLLQGPAFIRRRLSVACFLHACPSLLFLKAA